MTVLITLTVAGADSGPFNLYSNLDGYLIPFETGVSRAALLLGYSSSLVLDGTTIIRVLSVGEDCTNYIDITLTSTTTTTTTIVPTTTTTTTTSVPVEITMITFGTGTESSACASIIANLDQRSTRFSTSNYLDAGETIYNGPGLTNPTTGPIATYYGYIVPVTGLYAWAYVGTDGVVINSGYCS